MKRIKALTLPRDYPEEDVDLIRLINYRMFTSCISNEIRCAIVSLVAKGLTSAIDIANALGISRTAIYRHLNVLRRSGILIHKDGRFFVSARIFLVYDADVDNEGYIKVRIHPDKGGFIDEEVGFVLVKGQLCRCDICRAFDSCLRAVKNLAKKLDIKVRSEKPLDAFIEIAKEITYRDALSIIKNGYLIVKPSVVYEEIEGAGKYEETSV